MKRSFLLIISVVWLSVAAMSQSIGERQALDVAARFIDESGKGRLARLKGRAAKQLRRADIDSKNVYAFNVDGGGFVVVSGDSRTYPILGYSDSGNLSAEEMPANMRAWFDDYAEAIAELGDASVSTMGAPAITAPAIDKLITSQWNQKAPYNDMCPELENPGGKTTAPTGCPATAMAMVMDYHQWPQSACRAIPAYDFTYTKFGGIGTASMHLDELPPVTFEWDKMLRNYDVEGGTEEQRNAVATLMRYCGQSVRMSYGLNSSGSQESWIAYALRAYFDYDNSLHMAQREYYGIVEWEQMIYNELANKRPVPISAQSGGGGHSFVCDGYDGDGLFHINWGWSGKGDGFFRLSVLNPYDNTGVGSGSSQMGYCIRQVAIIGVKPSDGSSAKTDDEHYFYLYKPLAVENDSVDVWFIYESPVDPIARMECALGTVSDLGVAEPVCEFDSVFTARHAYYAHARIKVDASRLNAGVTRLLPMGRLAGEDDAQWVVMSNRETYVEATLVDGNLSLKAMPRPDLALDDAYLSTGGRPFEKAGVMLKLRNQGKEFNGVVDIYYRMSASAEIADDTKTAWSTLKTGLYVRESSVDSLSFYTIPVQKGYLQVKLCLDSDDATLVTAVLPIDGEIEPFALEVVDYEIDYTLEGCCSAWFVVKNNDTRDWLSTSGSLNYLRINVYEGDTGDDGEIVELREKILSGNTLKVGEPNLFIVEEKARIELVQHIGSDIKVKIFSGDIEFGKVLKPSVAVGRINADGEAGEVWYNMQGVRIARPKSPGFYIRNGEKVMVL